MTTPADSAYMDKPTNNRILIYLVPNVVVILLWLLGWHFAGSTGALNSWAERGQFGDMFGAVSSLFSALAFAWIIITVYLQSQELSLQREELKLTRDELRGQKDQLALQNATLRVQKFENTFFQLLQLHHDIVNSMERYVGNNPVNGRRNFDTFYNEFVKSFQATYNKDPNTEQLKCISDSFELYFGSREWSLGHYFRNLYNIVKFVDRSEIEDKRLYTNLIRAQLSAPELLLLFYDALGPYGREKFKPLIERYALLKNMPQRNLAPQMFGLDTDHTVFYAPSAFGK